MQKLATLLGSSIGKKVVMAVTGIVLFGYVAGHVTGNLLVFLGPEAINDYGRFLHTFLHGAGIWIARAVLLAAVALHVWAAVSLALDNRRARPVGYRGRKNRESTFASRTMILSGPVLAAFVVYHLAHFTTGSAHPDFVPGDVYHNLVAGFRSRGASAFYVVAMLALGLHMYHGVWSMLQTLGANHPRWNPLRNRVSKLATVLIVAGFLSVPVAVVLGMLKDRSAQGQRAERAGELEGARRSAGSPSGQRAARAAGLTPAAGYRDRQPPRPSIEASPRPRAISIPWERAGELEGARRSAPSLNDDRE